MSNAKDKHPPLNIEQARDLLSPYLDGEVTPAERALVEQALADSADLRRELGALRRTVALVSALPPVAAPRPFTLTEAQVRPKSTAPKRSIWGAPAWPMSLVAGLAAALLCVLAAGGLFWSMRFGGMPSSAPAAELAKAPEATALPVQAQLAAEPAEAGAEKPAAPPLPTEIPAPGLAAPDESTAQKIGPAALPTPGPPVTQEAVITPTEAPLPEMAAPASESDKLEAPANQLAGATAAPPVEGESLGAANAQEAAPTESAAADAAAQPSPAPATMALAAPAQEEAANAAGAEMKQAGESAPAPPAAAESRQRSEATATLLPTATLPPTTSPTWPPSPTVAAMLTLQPPPAPTPTTAPAPTGATTMSGESFWLIAAIVAILLVGGAVWLVSQNRPKGR
jgi:anti-sigma factor RsiW